MAINLSSVMRDIFFLVMVLTIPAIFAHIAFLISIKRSPYRIIGNVIIDVVIAYIFLFLFSNLAIHL